MSSLDAETMRAATRARYGYDAHRRYQGLDQILDALRYLGEGHARGKVVVAI